MDLFYNNKLIVSDNIVLHFGEARELVDCRSTSLNLPEGAIKVHELARALAVGVQSQ
ncbi:hypothetical protein GQ55_3G000700 [Panicum hallii var. hallii]|uniref:Uncharacterized protein n=1 Tax=Panicum hallii var. hallii TaxID=1504633 RepID=A0A2T7E4C3_9POAL|nr:hypothetical protein GQ55_3G000700 [Panicum hallii var. hallii]